MINKLKTTFSVVGQGHEHKNNHVLKMNIGSLFDSYTQHRNKKKSVPKLAEPLRLQRSIGVRG
jgi:hypothetical protein